MTTQIVPDRLALPPPLDLDLVDAGRTTGWIADNAVGFRGFGDETEAAHAAWVAHRTIARRLSRTHGMRPVPVDIEPLALGRIEAKEMILASGRPIAGLVRPGPDSRSVDSFGFELLIPTPISELEVRAMAYLVYRTLRKSGIRWAMWRPDASRVAEASTAETSVDATTDATERLHAEANGVTERPDRAAWDLLPVPTRRALTGLTRVALAVPALAAAAVLAVGVARFVEIPLAPLATVLVAWMGAGGVMLLRRRRLR
jgi:hypothetical protein